MSWLPSSDFICFLLMMIDNVLLLDHLTHLLRHPSSQCDCIIVFIFTNNQCSYHYYYVNAIDGFLSGTTFIYAIQACTYICKHFTLEWFLNYKKVPKVMQIILIYPSSRVPDFLKYFLWELTPFVFSALSFWYTC